MDTEAQRVLRFRCAETGRRFIVVFMRQHTSVRFTIAAIIDEKEVEESGKLGSSSPVKALQGSVERALVPVSEVVTHARNMIKRMLPMLFSANKPAPVEEPTASSSKESSWRYVPPKAPENENYNPSEFDFKGWYCPCCGHAKNSHAAHLFIQCGRCHEYICAARVKRLPNGSETFRCHNRCGGHGTLGGGNIESMTGMGYEKQKPRLLDDRSTTSRTLPPHNKRK